MTAQRLKIVDALAGRGDDSPLERVLHRGLKALSGFFGRSGENDGERAEAAPETQAHSR